MLVVESLFRLTFSHRRARNDAPVGGRKKEEGATEQKRGNRRKDRSISREGEMNCLVVWEKGDAVR